MTAPQEFDDSTLCLIRAETAVYAVKPYFKQRTTDH